MENISVMETLPGVEGSDLGTITHWGYFLLQGKVSSENPPETLQVRCNEKTIQLPALITDCKDEQSHFRIEIPGYLWEHVDENKTLSLSVLFNGGLLNTRPIDLSEKKALQWLRQIAKCVDNQKQYFSLLALEHLKYSDLLHCLPEVEQDYYQDFAKKMHLKKYLNKDKIIFPYKAKKTASTTVPASTFLLNIALKKLNTKIQKENVRIYAQVDEVVKEMRLSGGLLNDFVRAIIPMLCKNNQLLELKQLINFSRFYSKEIGKDNWSLSLAIPLLVADGQVLWAADIIWEISKKSGNDWINTECIKFALSHVQHLERQGQIEPEVAEKFRYAILDLMKSFNGEWFSRLHDQMLVDCAILMLSGLKMMTDYHRNDVIVAIVRHYGLNQVFWNCFEVENITISEFLFTRARKYWNSIYSIVESGNIAILENLSTLQNNLQFFIQRGNREGIIYLREILMVALQNNTKEVATELNRMSLFLLDSDQLETIRITAFPSEIKDLEDLISENSHNIYDMLLHQSDRAASILHKKQIEACENFMLFTEADANNDLEEVNKQLDVLPDNLVPLNNWNGMFLNADILAAVCSKSLGVFSYSIPILLEASLQRAIEESKADYFLPAPVCAAISTLEQLPEKSLGFKIFENAYQKIEKKFTVEHISLKETLKTRTFYLGSGWPNDTLVVIYSCRRYLNDRVAAIRKTWIKDLQIRNIPYMIIVGDGDDQVHDDILALDVEDTYEKLPYKTLKLFDWVYKNTNAQFVLKIDDDCYLDVEKYFNSLSYRKHHYYGRLINRNKGGMDRTWHHKKSRSEHAKKTIDKSPEPSVHADGGGAYCLSRISISQLLHQASTANGHQLLANSFMEDKLVGDLLSLSRIYPSDEDYECYQRRKLFKNAVPVGMFENIFFPSSLTPTKVTHLDTYKEQEWVHTHKKNQELWPKKIWPSSWPPHLRPNSNQLELLTDLDKTNHLLRNNLIVISVMRNENVILRHFLNHYRKIGVKTFIVADNCSDDGTREYLLSQDDVIVYSVDTEYKESHYGVSWQQAILANHCVNKWVVVADADEFLIFPDMENKKLEIFIAKIEQFGANCIKLGMVDMYPFKDLASADFQNHSPFSVAKWFDKKPFQDWLLNSGCFSNNVNWTSSLRHRIDTYAEPNSFVSQKFALVKYKPWMRFSEGFHCASSVKIHNSHAWFAHFKYHAGFKEKVNTEILRKQHFKDAKEYKRYASLLAERNDDFGDQNLSIEYVDSLSFL